ncbi:Peptidase family M50 [Rubripirellula amarantea]|uniref:Peptidase family M50 n=2 Tax=Rubripirellula amarantea TaxID=2527999 RepID=A0A5C5WHA4_9BACT|nr:Peptidase family M50 [Rubripirellula amarantea]
MQEQAAPSVRVVMDPSVTFEARHVGNKTSYVAHHNALGKFFHMGCEEHHVATLLDGSRDIGDIVAILQTDGLAWEASDVEELVKRFITSKLAMPIIDGAAQAAPPATNAPVPWDRRVPQLLSFMISQRIPLFACNPLADRMNKIFGAVFSPYALPIWVAWVASGLVVISSHRAAFADEVSRLFDQGLWVAMVVIWVIAKVFHELGHATAARYHNVRVGKAGIMFFMMAPLAYVDVTDAWRLSSRWKRIQIAMGGVYVELAIASAAAWLWWYLPDGYAGHLAAQFFLVAGPATVLVNANPLLRLDGYYVVSDLTEIPNLRMHGRNQLGGMLNWWLVKIPRQASLLHGWRRPFATAHALGSVLFQLVWMGGLVIGVAMWAKGLGVVLAAVATTLWAVIPLSRWFISVWRHAPSTNEQAAMSLGVHRRRLVGVAIIGMALIAYLVTMPSPIARRVPVVVRFHEAQVVRAASDAFVKEVHVTRGQRVEAGTLLMRLENPDLVVQRDEKADDMRTAQLRQIQFRQLGNLALSAAEGENAESLQRQLDELSAEVDALNIYAQREGLVVSQSIDHLLGSYVSKGTELLSVCDPQEKELLVSVSPGDMDAYQRAVDGGEMSKVRLRGGSQFRLKPQSLRPRARLTLPHPALGANAGGPLPVEPAPDPSTGSSELRPIEPQMESVVKLSALTSSEIQTGQLGAMTISDTRSLAARVMDSLKR